MQKEAVTDAKQRPGFQKDLRDRTKAFALRIVRIFSELPKTTEGAGAWEAVAPVRNFNRRNYREAFRARSKAEWSDRGERHRR